MINIHEIKEQLREKEREKMRLGGMCIILRQTQT